MYSFYSVLVLAIVVVASPWFVYQALRYQKYVGSLGQRMGYLPVSFNMDGDESIWIHAVSVGEVLTARPLISDLKRRHPGLRMFLSTTTLAGQQLARRSVQDVDAVFYFPFDLGIFVRRTLDLVRPRLFIMMETEIWPNLYAAAAGRGTRLFLVNARMSAKSAGGYARLGRLTRVTLQHLTAIAAQTEADAARLADLGAERITVCGNLKFDVDPPADTAARAAELRALFGNRRAWVAASTREAEGDSEEAMIVDAWLERSEKLGADPNYSSDSAHPLLVIVPRHPQRFDAVAAMLAARGVRFVRRSEGQSAGADTQIVLGDSMGEMAAYYAAADLAFIGGSLLPLGGQNLIEAAAAGCPVLIGPHSFNFEAATEAALAAGAAVRVTDADALAEEVTALLAEPARLDAMRDSGRAFAAQHRGATARILAVLETTLRKC